MPKFKLVDLCDEKKIGKYSSSGVWKSCVLLPYYRERYMCFCNSEDLSFEELTQIFIQGNDDNQIGAMSMIAERYPCELYQLICSRRNDFSPQKLRWIFDCVVPDYLPLVLPKERLMDYMFDKEFSNNIWVNILVEIRSLLKAAQQ